MVPPAPETASPAAETASPAAVAASPAAVAASPAAVAASPAAVAASPAAVAASPAAVAASVAGEAVAEAARPAAAAAPAVGEPAVGEPAVGEMPPAPEEAAPAVVAAAPAVVAAAPAVVAGPAVEEAVPSFGEVAPAAVVADPPGVGAAPAAGESAPAAGIEPQAVPPVVGRPTSTSVEADPMAFVHSVRPKRRVRVVLAIVAALAVLLLGVVLLKPDAAPEGAAAAATSGAPASPAATPTPATPYDLAVATLNTQAEALLRGDEAAWLAAVDPGKAPLIAKYRVLFRNLRGLGVTRFEYKPGLGKPVKGDAEAVSMRIDAFYCFGAEMCPATAATEWAKPPHISQTLTMRAAGGKAAGGKAISGKYVISALGASTDPDYHQPLPWENTDLVFAKGARVVLAAPKGQEKYLARVLPVAVQAAAVADHFAALNGTPQRDYRIFLAGEKQWKTWYGGEPDEWAIGLAMPLNRRGIDVIIRMSEMEDALTLRTTVQHELGHVVTLTGAFQMDAVEDTWLSEGIAEYIGWKPKGAAGSFRKYSVKWQLDRDAPKSMVPPRPGPKAPARAGDAFYGLSHWAADCMSQKYGEAKLFTFVRLVLTEDNSYEQASEDAYGIPFTTVDKVCVSWIRKQAS
jgi:hypothetical protein